MTDPKWNQRSFLRSDDAGGSFDPGEELSAGAGGIFDPAEIASACAVGFLTRRKYCRLVPALSRIRQKSRPLLPPAFSTPATAQSRRESGEAQEAPKPDGMGPVTFDAATRTLRATAMPAHATSLRAYRKPAGGDAVLAGVSTTLEVPVSSYAPLETGVAYEMWVVGYNAQGEGPASPHVSYTA